MSALGEEFRSAREARGLSLSDVAERLHIRSIYLAAIEEEDWSAIGAAVYVRGFMRTYARFLGLDAESAVARFTAIAPAAAAAPGLRSSISTAVPEERPAERRSPSLFAVAAILLAVALLAFVGYSFYEYRSAGPTPAPAALASATPSAPAIAAPAAVPSAAPVPTVAAPVKPAARHGLSLKLTQRSWLRVAVDGRVAVEGIFPAGTAKSFAGTSADVRVGNAGGVRAMLNGRDLGSLGADGDVVERQFNLGGE